MCHLIVNLRIFIAVIVGRCCIDYITTLSVQAELNYDFKYADVELEAVTNDEAGDGPDQTPRYNQISGLHK